MLQTASKHWNARHGNRRVNFTPRVPGTEMQHQLAGAWARECLLALGPGNVNFAFGGIGSNPKFFERGQRGQLF